MTDLQGWNPENLAGQMNPKKNQNCLHLSVRLLWSEVDSICKTSRWYELWSLSVCLSALKTYSTSGWFQREERRLCGKVITCWCKAGALQGFSASSKGNKILIRFLLHFSLSHAAPFPSILPITRFINVILKIICLMYVGFWVQGLTW